MKIRISLSVLALAAMCAFPTVASAVDPVPVPIPGNRITLRDVVYLVEKIVNYGIILASVAVVAMIVYAGFKMAISRGVETEYKKGKEILKYAIYGALVVFAVGLIVNTIANVAYNPTRVLY